MIDVSDFTCRARPECLSKFSVFCTKSICAVFGLSVLKVMQNRARAVGAGLDKVRVRRDIIKCAKVRWKAEGIGQPAFGKSVICPVIDDIRIA